jgi:hypothetical protein
MMRIPTYLIQRQLLSQDLRVIMLRDAHRQTSSRRAVGLDNDNSHSRRDQYVYVDVGRWGGRNRNFGVIYGDRSESYIAVCQYIPPPPEEDEGDEEVRDPFTPISELPAQTDSPSSVARTVIDFINHCRGDILYAARFDFVDTGGRLYLALGDLHLPLASRLSRPRRSPLPEIQCRVDTAYMQGLDSEAGFVQRAINSGVLSAVVATGADRMMLDSPVTWYQRYVRNDIFTDASSNAAADDLKNFINLAQSSGTNIHFVQLGDMYELWVGLKCLFAGTDPGDRQVNLRSLPCSMRSNCYLQRISSLSQGGCTVTSGYQEAVRQWVSKVHQTTRVDGQSLAEWLHRDRFPAQSWLYGNHDNYLRTLSGQLGIPTRTLILHESGSQIQFEHGHEADEYNRDGAVSGHAITQGAAFVWDQRWLDSLLEWLRSRRPNFIRYAAEKFIRRNDPIKVFVMAHTHIPYLAIVILNI